MPLRALAGVQAPVELPAEPTPQPRQPIVESPFVTWTPADGDEVILSETGGDFILQRGVMGIGMPPEEQFETKLAGGDGSILNHARADVAEVMLPIRLRRSPRLAEREQLKRNLIRLFDRRRGAGTLKWAWPDGSARFLTCMYAGGLESPVDGHRGALQHIVYQVILRAHDPYWHGEEQVVTFSLGAGGAFYPIPFTISPSTTTGDSTILIDGEDEVSPIWETRGPCSTQTLRNRDTGQTLSLTPNLSAGQGLRVNTADSAAAGEQIQRGTVVEDPDGGWHLENLTNAWAVGGQFPVMWALQPGSNRVTVLAAGTASSSQVKLRYRPRYLGA